MSGKRKTVGEIAHHAQPRDSEQEVESVFDLYYEHAVKERWMFSATQARSREMCERILNAANAVFAKDGYEAAKIADIAQAADCSVGIFYKRFADKESMFCVLQYRHLAEARRQLGRFAEMVSSPLSTEDILYRFVRATVRYMLREPGYQRALIEISLKERRVWKAQQDHHRFAGDTLIDFLIARDELPQPDQDLRQRGRFAMRVIFGVVQSLMLVGPGPYDVKDPRVVDNLAEILRGFLREEQALSGHPVNRPARKRKSRRSQG